MNKFLHIGYTKPSAWSFVAFRHCNKMEATFEKEDDANFSDTLLKNIEQGNNAEVLSILQTTSPSRFTDSSGSTLLHVAARYNNVWLLRHLIASGENVNAPNHSKETPLMIAITHNQLETVEVLLAANADIFLPDVTGRCALRKASDNIHLTGAKSAWDPDTLKISCRIVTALQDRVTIESLSNSKHIDNQAFHADCPLHTFVSLKNAGITRILLEKGSPVNAKESGNKRTALHIAVEQLDIENVKVLLEYGADANARTHNEDTPLACFCNFSDRDRVIAIFKTLTDAGAALYDRDRGLILARCLLTKGDKEIVRSVLSCKIDLHFMDQDGYTVLHHLAYNPNVDVLAELRCFDFDVNVRARNWNRTMLHCAALSGNVSSIEFLLERGADVNATCCYNYKPLNLMLVYHKHDEPLDDYVKCVEVLLAKGADPQIVTKKNSRMQSHVFNEPLCDNFVKLMDSVLIHLALVEASGRMIIQATRSAILSVPKFKNAFDMKTRELERMKQTELRKSVALLDFLIANDEEISQYARSRKIRSSSLSSIIETGRLDLCLQLKLRVSCLKFTKHIDMRNRAATVIYGIFVELCNVTVYNIAEQIVSYLDDRDLYKFL